MPAKKSSTMYIDIGIEEGGIVSRFLSKKTERSSYNPEDIEVLRKLFSNQKTRILYTLKREKPKSIYDLAKILKRDFKSVYADLKFLERFGFVEFYSEKNGKKESLRPVLRINALSIQINI
jgi:predicted transcriptional regulator